MMSCPATYSRWLAILAILAGLQSVTQPLVANATSAVASGRSSALAEQSASYVAARKEIIIRYGATTERSIKVSVRPLKLAAKVRPGEKTVGVFRFSNLSDSPVTFRARSVVTPAQAAELVKRHASFCDADITMPARGQPGATMDREVEFTVDSALSPAIDTIALHWMIEGGARDQASH